MVMPVEKSEYERRWNSYIDELERLNWNLHADDHERVEELQEELREIVEVAAENDRREEEDGLMDMTYERLPTDE